jgi:hypothetical protein
MDTTKDKNVLVLKESDLMAALVDGLILSFSSRGRIMAKRCSLAQGSPLRGCCIELPKVVVFDVIVAGASKDIETSISCETCGKRRSWLRSYFIWDFDQLPGESLILLVKTVHIVHLGSIPEAANHVDWLLFSLIALETDHAKIISGARMSFAVQNFLLSCWDCSKIEVIEINNIEDIA